MYGIIMSAAWPQYYASSPFLNLLNLKHSSFEVIPMDGLTLNNPTIIERLRCFDGLVIDDVWILPVMKKIEENGVMFDKPVLMVDGDPHRNRPHEIADLEAKYRASTHVLTGAVFSKKMPRYFYPSEELRQEKFVYYPHSAPSGPPPKKTWDERLGRLLVSGSTSREVYPYRWSVAGAPWAYTLPFQERTHMEYFNEVSKWKMAATCQSVLEYTVAKYFEIPWCGSMLVAQPLARGEGDILGFKHGHNCMLLETYEVYEYVSNCNSTSYEPIAKAGHELIMKRHTIDSRGDYLAALFNKIVSGGFKPGDAFGIFQNIPERPL